MDFVYEKERIYLPSPSGGAEAEITFPHSTGNVHIIDRTYVDPSLGGRGIGGKLVQAAAEYLRSSQLKAIVTCPFARSWFIKHPEYSDILV